MIQYALRLLREIEQSKTGWRLEREATGRDRLALFAAIRDSDTSKLTPSWWTESEDHRRDEFIIDPLGQRIPQVWSDMLFGEEPVIEAPRKSDQERMDDWVDANDFPTMLKWGEEVCSSEGEVWYRHVSVPALGHAILEFHSRLNVIPLWVGRKLKAVAFVSILEQDENDETVYIEVHAEGITLNRLYQAKVQSKLDGKEIPLGNHPDTEDVPTEWVHDLPDMLAGRIPNRLGRDWRWGISDYQGLTGLLNALNEIANIGQDNARLTAKQRVVLPERYLNLKGQLPRGSEVIVATEVDMDPDKIKNEFAQITWEFDAAALIAYKDSLTDTILTRARIAPQLVGRGHQDAETGPANRGRLIDTLLAANGKGKFWDDIMPTVLRTGARVENLPGIGAGWQNVDKLPHFKRKDPVPEDQESVSRRTVMEVNAKVLSRKTAITTNNPDWSEARVTEELKNIREERDLEQKLASAPDGTSMVPDPAGSIPRAPGQADPSAVPDPRRTNGRT